MSEDKDILEMFFEALASPKATIVTEMLSNQRLKNLTKRPLAGIIGGRKRTKGKEMKTWVVCIDGYEADEFIFQHAAEIAVEQWGQLGIHAEIEER